MEKQFLCELIAARRRLIDEVLNTRWNVFLRVAAEDVIILIDQLIEENKSILDDSENIDQ